MRSLSLGSPRIRPSPRRSQSDRVLGTYTLVAAAVAASLALALGVWRRRSRAWLIAAAAFGLLFAGDDTRELVHQLDESRRAVAIIAALLIALHLLIAALAAAALTRRQRPAATPAAETP